MRRALAATENWRESGPADRRCYDVPDEDSENNSAAIAKCASLLQSDAFCLMLSGMTGLKLHPLAPDDSSEDEVWRLFFCEMNGGDLDVPSKSR